MRRKGLVLVAAGIVASFAAGGTANAAVTIGSDLTNAGPFSNSNCGVPCTTANLALIPASTAPGGLASPVTGTVTSFSVRSGSTGNVNLRILRPGTGLNFTAVGISALSPINNGLTTTATQLPIQAGDMLGLNNPAGHLVIAANPGANQIVWAPPLAEGATLAGASAGNFETMVQATVDPTNTVTFGAVARNKKKGTASLTVNVPNPGTLSYSGTGIAITGPGSVGVPSAIQLTLRATGKKRKKLLSKGKVGVSPIVTFTPNNGTAGKSTGSVKLVKKL